MNYEGMSDFEINLAVSDRYLWNFSDCEQVDYCKKEQKVYWGDGANWHEFDPCNNPSNAWPIMSENLIGVSPDEDGVTCHFYGDWTATAFCSQVSCTHKKPLRAAMIVFLMMRDEQCQKK